METALKRKDTTKGPPLRILSLDGGGVRGYSIFIILQEIMHRTFVEIYGRAPHRNEIPKPADHFDLIVGTGTGGLIALMLGRLRLNIETCKELYVRLTRMVFETDKTILGIPTRPTLFKASRLEQAIKDAVQAHTVDENEGKDLYGPPTISTPTSARPGGGRPRRHASNASVVSFSARSPTSQMARPYYTSDGGDPDALLYDEREKRTKTVVTAMYKGSRRGARPIMLRSYDSRREPAPEFECRIWEAGRATCAIGLAFKPIQIGQSIFHDDGSGTFNPAPYALEEATVNEWPGREVGIFLSVGTGKRPKNSDQNNPMWYDGFLGEFAEARKRLVAKIEGCEIIHEAMLREHLPKRGVNVEHYYRLNVEVGVGEFGMNEWNRLADISSKTKGYLDQPAEHHMVETAATKLAKINRAILREKQLANVPEQQYPQQPYPQQYQQPLEVDMPLAVELPAEVPANFATHSNHGYSPRQSYESNSVDRLSIPHQNGSSPSPRSSSERFPHSSGQPSPIAEAPSESPPLPPPPSRQAPPYPHSPAAHIGGANTPPRTTRPRPASSGARIDEDRLVVTAPTPEQWRNAASNTEAHRQNAQLQQPSYPAQHQQPQRIEPPPLPPKTPLPDANGRASRRPPIPTTTYGAPPLGGAPYPIDDDEPPPPPVNKARKPEYRAR